MNLKSYKIDEEVLSPEKFPLDEFEQYVRPGDFHEEGSVDENDNSNSHSTLAGLCHRIR